MVMLSTNLPRAGKKASHLRTSGHSKTSVGQLIACLKAWERAGTNSGAEWVTGARSKPLVGINGLSKQVQELDVGLQMLVKAGTKVLRVSKNGFTIFLQTLVKPETT